MVDNSKVSPGTHMSRVSRFASLVLGNYGIWEGTFTGLNREADELEVETTALVFWTDSEENRNLIEAGFVPSRVTATIRRLNRGEDYSQTFYLEKDILTHRNGTAIALGGHSSTGARNAPRGDVILYEARLVHQDRRRRLVLVYDREGRFERMTYIREKRQARDGHGHLAPVVLPDLTKISMTREPVAPAPTLADLVGEWVGWSEDHLDGGAMRERAASRRVVAYNRRAERVALSDDVMPLAECVVTGVDIAQQRPKYVLTTPAGVEHLFLYNNGCVSRVPLVFDYEGKFVYELAWLLSPNVLLSQRRVHVGGAFSEVKFSLEQKVLAPCAKK